MDVVFPPGYPRKFLECVAFTCRWRQWKRKEGIWYNGRWEPGFIRIALWCPNDKAQRFDVLDDNDDLKSRQYIQPEGKKIEGYNLAHLRKDARSILFRDWKQDPETPDEDPEDW